ncbi:MAG: glycosyltransferase [Chloroflexi bacterium]|nr:glycosyltransferase [Chloroflexota bacterium]
MTQPLISVIIPAYNHASFIAEAVCSVTDQDYPSLELIVVDDGSSDDTADRAEGTLKGHKIPFQIVRQSNQGAHVAINNGIALARGEWIAILNSDDRFSPFRIARLLDHAARTKSRFVFSGIAHVDDAGNPLPASAPHVYYYRRALQSRELYPTPNFEFLRHQYALSTGNFFFHRSLTEQVGPFRDLKICHDWDFILRVLLVEEPAMLDEPLYEYRVHENNTVRPEVNDLRFQEMDTLLSSYLQNAENASNALAPCYKNWGIYWRHFLTHEMIFGYLPKTAIAIKQIMDASPAQKDAPLKQDMLANALANSHQRIRALDEKLSVMEKQAAESKLGRKSSLSRIKNLLRRYWRY